MSCRIGIAGGVVGKAFCENIQQRSDWESQWNWRRGLLPSGEQFRL
ncbi:MAG: hypothetical protein KF838_00110 [Phycisphaeraceae bacterium]|nr:MAG: hypothetical protein KF838_00110 [Phycisphaeraceae bacterium]